MPPAAGDDMRHHVHMTGTRAAGNGRRTARSSANPADAGLIECD